MRLSTHHQLNAQTQHISALWESLAKLASNRCKDNARSSEYPLSCRERQLESVKALVDAIEKTHVDMTKSLQTLEQLEQTLK